MSEGGSKDQIRKPTSPEVVSQQIRELQAAIAKMELENQRLRNEAAKVSQQVDDVREDNNRLIKIRKDQESSKKGTKEERKGEKSKAGGSKKNE